MTDEAMLYRTAPQMEFRAADELDRSGYILELPVETITRHAAGRKPTVRHVPIMRQYISATGKPYNAKYVGKAIGRVKFSDVRRIQSAVEQSSSKRPHNPFSLGQAVIVGEVPGVVASTQGEDCTVAVTMFDKQHLRVLHYSRLRPG